MKGDKRAVALCERDVVNPLSETDVDDALQRIKKKSRGQRSPVSAAEAVISGAKQLSATALVAERQTFLRLQADDQSKALRYIFFAERTVTKVTDLKSVAARDYSKLGVIGGGTMGAGIAAAA